MNAECYLEFSNNRKFLDNLLIMKRQHLWYQHDGAPC